MPTLTLDTIATPRSVYACIHDRYPRGGCGYYRADGHYRPVTNLGWLLRHASEVVDLWVSVPGSRARFAYVTGGTLLAARLTNGRVYVSTWQDPGVLHRWLARPSLTGLPVTWNGEPYIVGSHDYRGLADTDTLYARTPVSA